MGEVTGTRPSGAQPFWERPLESLSRTEWEALCDGCGKCCCHKIEDEDTGEFYDTNVACKLLDLDNGQCRDYRNRRAFVPDCVRLTMLNVRSLPWLPETCAYRRRAEGLPLPKWHYLLIGDRNAVHRAGASVIGKAISEIYAGPLEHHIILPDGEEDDGEEG